jgi:cytokinin dehydrogenase
MVNKNSLPHSLAMPSGDVAIFAVLPTGVPKPLLDDALSGIQKAHEILLAAGGKRYLAGWLGAMDSDAWRRHYGDYYDSWVAAKQSFDPNGILCSSLLPTA